MLLMQNNIYPSVQIFKANIKTFDMLQKLKIKKNFHILFFQWQGYLAKKFICDNK